MKRLLLLAAVCAIAAAMVPRERRAINTEEEPRPSTTTIKLICAATTPCGWAFYKPHSKPIADQHIKNDYCECAIGSTCQLDEEDSIAYTRIKRCKPKSEEPEEPQS